LANTPPKNQGQKYTILSLPSLAILFGVTHHLFTLQAAITHKNDYTFATKFWIKQNYPKFQSKKKRIL